MISSKQKQKASLHMGRSSSHPAAASSLTLTTAAALEQCNHLIQLQDALLRNALNHKKEMVDKSMLSREECDELRRELERERVEHTKTKCLLSAEEEKAQLALTEVHVLKKQLEREKSTFEKAFGLLKSQALCDSTKSESLLAKCSALESMVAGKDESIARLEGQVQELTERVKEMRLNHKAELQEMNVRVQQEKYLAKYFRELGGGRGDTNRTVAASRSSSSSGTYSVRKPKLKH